MSQSLHQRWRERPRCPALPLTPGCHDGVVHAIVGRVACRCHACPVRAGRTRRPRAHVRGQSSPEKAVGDRSQESVRARAMFPAEARRVRRARFEPDHHRVFDAGAVLGVVNALRFASTRPVAGPAGIDDACARHAIWQLRDGGHRDDGSRTSVDAESRGRMLASSRQCRTALLRFATTAIRSAHSADAPRARFGAHPSQHRSLLQDHRERLICTP